MSSAPTAVAFVLADVVVTAAVADILIATAPFVVAVVAAPNHSPKNPPLGPFHTISNHLASENHLSPTPQHDSETRSTANIPVRVFLYNLCTVTSLPLEV